MILVHRIAAPEPHLFDLLDPDPGVQIAIRYPKKVNSKYRYRNSVFLFFTHFSSFYNDGIQIIIHNSKNPTFWALRSGSQSVMKITGFWSVYKLIADLQPLPATSVGDPWHWGADPDPRIQTYDLWIRIRFISSVTLKTPKKFFSYFFYNLPSSTLSSVLTIDLLKFCVNILFCKHTFQAAQHLYEKREGSGAGSVPLTSVSGSGRFINMRILRIRIPNTAAT